MQLAASTLSSKQNAEGRYTVTNVPDGLRVSIFAGSPGANQPCAAGGIYDANVGMTRDITLYSDEDLHNGVPLPANGDVWIRGTVRDNNNDPIADAWLNLDLSQGEGTSIPALTTRSAANGEYWFPIQLPFWGQSPEGHFGIGDVNITQNTESDIFLN